MAATNPYADITVVPRIAIKLPLPLPIPDGFEPERPETWPVVEGRLEYVEGRLEYMPPCGEIPQRVVTDVVYQLRRWTETNAGYVVGTNEAGMILGGEVRGADAAIWRSAPPGPGYARTPPILAVEVSGRTRHSRCSSRSRAGISRMASRWCGPSIRARGAFM